MHENILYNYLLMNNKGAERAAVWPRLSQQMRR